MDHKKVQKYLGYAMRGLFIVLGVLVVFSVFVLEYTKKPQAEIDAILQERLRHAEQRVLGKEIRKKEERHLPDPWPPEMNVAYPNLILLDKNGKEFLLSDHAGKVVILEYVDMSLPLSQAQSGSALLGAYGSTQEIDKFAVTFENALRKEVGEKLVYPNTNMLEIKVLVYTQDGGQPGVNDATDWAEHFDLSAENNVIVAVAKSDLRAESTKNMIGGYQLLDHKRRLRVDSSGAAPKHSLRMTFVPLAHRLSMN